VIENLLASADAILIGGAMAYTFLLARGFEVGRSLVEPDLADSGHVGWQARAAERGVKLMRPGRITSLPPGPTDDARGAKNISVAATGKDEMGLDIGTLTREQYTAIIATANTIFWNGPMGMFEKPPFDAGTPRDCQIGFRCDGTPGRDIDCRRWRQRRGGYTVRAG
jgi:phosphoglycerate kinase